MKMHMMAGLFTLALAGSVQAAQCPVDMKKIDEAISKNPQLTSEQMAEVQRLRTEGEAQHTAGKHKESMETLAKAKRILKIEK